MPKYSVLVHLKQILVEHEGALRVAGAYAYHFVTTSDPATAARMAVERMLADPRILSEARNPAERPIEALAEEVLELTDEAVPEQAETGVVFYIDTDQEQQESSWRRPARDR
jgi:hypothetical protein